MKKEVPAWDFDANACSSCKKPRGKPTHPVYAFFVGAGGLNAEQADQIMIALTDPKWGATTLPLLFAMSDDELMECFKGIEAFALRKLAVHAVKANRPY